MTAPLFPFPYYGGKVRMLDFIHEHLPMGHGFVDLFGGSAVVALSVSHPHGPRRIHGVCRKGGRSLGGRPSRFYPHQPILFECGLVGAVLRLAHACAHVQHEHGARNHQQGGEAA